MTAYRCVRCGDQFSAWQVAQRHADTEHGGAAIDLVLIADRQPPRRSARPPTPKAKDTMCASPKLSPEPD